MNDDYLIKTLLFDKNIIYKIVNQDAILEEEIERVIEKNNINISVEEFTKIFNLTSKRGSDSKENKGLYVGLYKINKLSGPTSLSILIPNNSSKKINNNEEDGTGKQEEKSSNYKDLPIILLLGDSHDTINYECAKCNCSLSSVECCMRSFDEKFLKNLDLLSTNENLVDIYVEGFSKFYKRNKSEYEILNRQKHLENKNKVNHQMFMFKQNFYKCFDKLKDNAYKKYCPTNTIRWYFSDPRISENEDITETNLFNIVRRFDEDNFNIKKIKFNKYFQLLQTLVTSPNVFINKILDDTNSLLCYEFSQCSKDIQIHVKEYLFEYIRYIQNSIQNFNILMDIFTFKTEQNSILTNKDIYIYLISLTSFITEIYSFLKMLQKNKKPWLQVMVLGHAHCNNFIYFLVNIFKKYKIYYKNGLDNLELDYKNHTLFTKSQCIEMNQDVHLCKLYNTIFGKEIKLNYNYFNNSFINKYSSIHQIRNLYLGLDFTNLITSKKIIFSNVIKIVEKKYNVLEREIINSVIKLKELENTFSLFYYILKIRNKDIVSEEIQNLENNIITNNEYYIDDSLYFLLLYYLKNNTSTELYIWNTILKIKPMTIEFLNINLSNDLFISFLIECILEKKVFPNIYTLEKLNEVKKNFNDEKVLKAIKLCESLIVE